MDQGGGAAVPTPSSWILAYTSIGFMVEQFV